MVGSCSSQPGRSWPHNNALRRLTGHYNAFIRTEVQNHAAADGGRKLTRPSLPFAGSGTLGQGSWHEKEGVSLFFSFLFQAPLFIFFSFLFPLPLFFPLYRQLVDWLIDSVDWFVDSHWSRSLYSLLYTYNLKIILQNGRRYVLILVLLFVFVQLVLFFFSCLTLPISVFDCRLAVCLRGQKIRGDLLFKRRVVKYRFNIQHLSIIHFAIDWFFSIAFSLVLS